MTDFVTSPIRDFSPIPVDEGGLFSPASGAAIDLAVRLVNKCVELAETKDADFAMKMDALTNATTGFLVAHAAAGVTAGSITAPTPTEPSMTVSDTTSAPDASIAFLVSTKSLYLPVPTQRRDVNSRPAITKRSLIVSINVVTSLRHQ